MRKWEDEGRREGEDGVKVLSLPLEPGIDGHNIRRDRHKDGSYFRRKDYPCVEQHARRQGDSYYIVARGQYQVLVDEKLQVKRLICHGV